ELEGKVRGSVGDALDNRDEHIKGRAKEMKGKIKRKFGEVQQDVAERDRNRDRGRIPGSDTTAARAAESRVRRCRFPIPGTRPCSGALSTWMRVRAAESARGAGMTSPTVAISFLLCQPRGVEQSGSSPGS